MNGIQDWFLAFGVMEIVIIFVVFLVLVLLLQTFFLYLALKIADASNTSFGDVFISALLMALVSWIPILGCILQWIIISKRHETSFLKAIGIWLLAGLLPIIIVISVVFFLVIPMLPALI